MPDSEAKREPLELTKDEAREFLAIVYGGEHHIPGEIKEYGCGQSMVTQGGADLATYDFDTLTTLVFLAHDRCIRASVTAVGRTMVRIALWKREREGPMARRHPTLAGAIAEWRLHHPTTEVVGR